MLQTADTSVERGAVGFLDCVLAFDRKLHATALDASTFERLTK
jgi:hypothetical protein